jgi:hypothetical protein
MTRQALYDISVALGVGYQANKPVEAWYTKRGITTYHEYVMDNKQRGFPDKADLQSEVEREWMSAEPLSLTHQDTLAYQARTLSYSSMVTLSGYKEYALIDELRTAFVAYCEQHSHYRCWQEAWKAFQKTREPQGQKGAKPVQQELSFGLTLIEERKR